MVKAMNFNKYDLFKSEVYKFKHTSGLNVEYIKKRGFKTKAVMLSVKYGALDNEFIYNGASYKFNPGLAHAIEHLIYKKDNIDYFLELSNLGTSPNAETTYDSTTFEFITTSDVYKPLEVTLDFLFNAKFNSNLLEQEKKIILSEAKMLNDDNDYILISTINKLLYNNSTFKNTTIGSYEDIKGITLDMLEKSYEAFYNPNNMLLTVVGDIDFDKINDILDKFFINKTYKPLSFIRCDNIINSHSINTPFYLKLKDNDESRVILSFKANVLDEFEIEVYNALFYIFYSPSSLNLESLTLNNNIEYGFYFIEEESDRYLYFYFNTTTKNTFKTIEALKNNFNNLDISYITNSSLTRYKKSIYSEYVPLSNDIYDLCDNAHLLSIIGMDLFNKINILNNLNIDILKKYFNDFKNMEYSIIYTKK